MRREERLAATEARAKEKLDADRKRLATVQAKRRADQRQRREYRRYQVGKLVDEAGLFVWDDDTLRHLFTLLASLVHESDPVAVLRSLLWEMSEVDRQVQEGVVDGRADADASGDPCGVSLARAH